MVSINRKINTSATVSEIVSNHYETADVFRSYGIDFCCGGKLPLKKVCEMNELDLDEIEKKLEASIRRIWIPATAKFQEWDIDFLTNYLVNIHHEYLRSTLPVAAEYLDRFVEGHRQKFPHLVELKKLFNEMAKDMMPHLMEEEEVIFPYIRHIAHAYESKESYASLFVRTLRKPVENMMKHEHECMARTLGRMRKLTDHYTPPSAACPNHIVTYKKLQEIDNDLVQHMHLENDILFPRAISMEKELLQRKEIG
jgi:regulator of cell morphogenesis and NO signaling